jgi:ubiquinone biosynthesis protein
VINPVQFFRLMQIFLVIMRHGFTPDVVGKRSKSLRFMSHFNLLRLGNGNQTRGQSVCTTLEKLGPIFIKFGQLLSTRQDLIPEDIVDELEKLQDRVAPFPGEVAKQMIEAAFGQPTEQLFREFQIIPIASASIAQVHSAVLYDGSEVVLKVLRPQVERVIRHDIALMKAAAKLVEKFWPKSRRIHPYDLVLEFEHTILDELDLMREAANASQLRRNFHQSPMMYVPKIYWHYTRTHIMMMERIYGVPINDIATLKAQGVNLKKLAEYGVEIFFTQVFRDSFFHADMHPGNLFVDTTDPENPRYIGVDFGIMGTLCPDDQRYLAANLVAFFNRDYREVAVLHIESGWVPADTRVDQFESAIRTVCEPIFERPLGEISFGQLLLRLFQTAERFKMEVQPQLMLLQKTMLSIEGLGRQLYPELDLWANAKPFMTRFVRKTRGLRPLLRSALRDWQTTVEQISKTPAQLFELLHELNRAHRLQKPFIPSNGTTNTTNKKAWFYGAATALSITAGASLLLQHQDITAWQWGYVAGAAFLWMIGLLAPTKKH